MSEVSPRRSPPETNPVAATDTVVRTTEGRRPGGGLFAFRRPVPQWAAVLLGLLCLTLVLGVWWFLTRGPQEERLIGYNSLPAPSETFNREQIDDLWFNNALTRNLLVSLRRVVLGFA